MHLYNSNKKSNHIQLVKIWDKLKAWIIPVPANTNSEWELLYRKSTIGTTVGAIDVNNDMYFLQKRVENFPLVSTTIESLTQSTFSNQIPCCTFIKMLPEYNLI